MTISTTIPGVATIHERVVWEPVGYRMALDFTRTPPPYPTTNITRPVGHYTGAMNVPDGDPGDEHNCAAFLARAQREYLEKRTGGGYIRKSDGRYFPGYPLGYHFGFDWLGGVWVIRGFDFLSAATNGHNGYTIACLFFVDGADKANGLMWASARAVAREARRRSGRADFAAEFTDHGSLRIDTGVGTATACSGAGIRSQLATEGRLDYEPPEEPPMRVFNVEATPMPVPPPLFASADGLTAVWLSEAQHKALGSPSWEGRPIPRAECRRGGGGR